MWFLTSPDPLAEAALPNHEPDLANGEYMFAAAGCASCHAAPEEGADPTRLVGGVALASPFGTFYAPNISPDPDDGIGGWSTLDFINAMIRGVSPAGAHYFPAFPYGSYQRMRLEDIIDLKAYLDTLPAVSSEVPDHDVPFPYNIRRAVGVWKLLYFDGAPFQPDPAADDEVNRGAYLVQGPGHCGECHSPRDALGGIIQASAYAGAPSPDGRGTVPNLTPHPTGLTWSKEEIAQTFKDGFTPEFDTLGGDMAEVQQNLSELTDADRLAIAAYLKSLPPRATASGDDGG